MVARRLGSVNRHTWAVSVAAECPPGDFKAGMCAPLVVFLSQGVTRESLVFGPDSLVQAKTANTRCEPL